MAFMVNLMTTKKINEEKTNSKGNSANLFQNRQKPQQDNHLHTCTHAFSAANKEKPELNKTFERTLTIIHEKSFGTNLSEIITNQFAYRKASYEYLKEAEGKGIGLDEALNFHDKQVEPVIRKLYEPRTGGQKPSKILHINSSMDRSSSILSHGAGVNKKGIYADAAFVIDINVREKDHFPEDFQPSAYMNGHTVKHDKYAILYEPFITPFGSENMSRGSTEKKELYLLSARRDVFISQTINAGFHVETENGVPYRISHIGGKMHKTYLPLVLHDMKNCKYYAYENGKKMLLEEWFIEMKLNNHPSIKNDIETLALHRKEKPYFDKYVNMVSKRKKIECTDSRENDVRNETRNSIRIIGAVLTDNERKRMLQSKGVEYITDGPHFGCGYLTTAMKLHEVGAEIKSIFEKGEKEGKTEEVASARRFLKSGIDNIFNGNFKGFGLSDLTAELANINSAPISEGANGLLKELLKSDKADLREIARHMSERGILEWNNEIGTLVMPAALNIDTQIGKSSRLLWNNRGNDKDTVDMLQKEYFKVVTIQVARDLDEAWKTSLVETGAKVKVRIVIKNYNDGISYIVKDNELYDPHTDKIVEEI